MNIKSKCTLLVCSCDAYEDLWDPFFKVLHDEWPDYPIDWPVVLNTESKDYNTPYFDVTTFGFGRRGKKMTWSHRMEKTLKAIDTEYVLVILDDYFQEKQIKQSRIEKVISWMDEDEGIAVFYFSNIQDMDAFHIKDGKYSGFELNRPGCPYCICAQTGLWRRKKLLNYIYRREDVWQFEELASERAAYYNDKIYSAILGSDYIMRHRWENGGALRGGKWSVYVPELLKKHEIEVDYSKRGFYAEELDGNPSVPANIGFIWKLFRPPLIRRILKHL